MLFLHWSNGGRCYFTARVWQNDLPRKLRDAESFRLHAATHGRGSWEICHIHRDPAVFPSCGDQQTEGSKAGEGKNDDLERALREPVHDGTAKEQSGQNSGNQQQI